MIFLDDTTTTLEIDLTSVVTTNQLPFVACYVDISTSTFAVTGEAAQTGTSNSTTAVTAVAAPGATTTRQIKYFSWKNSDTVEKEGWVQLNENGTLREIWKGTLAVGDTLVYMDGSGWSTIDSTGHIKTTGGVNGPGSSTDNAIARWNGTAGNSIQDASNATISDAGQLALTVTGSAGGILIGGDAQWYRSAADVMRTPDSVIVDGNLTVSASAESNFTGDIKISRSLSGGDVVSSAVNTSNTATSNAFVRATVSGASAGDAALHLLNSGVTEWYAFLDNSDSDAFKIATSLTSGTAIAFSTAGVMTVPNLAGVGSRTVVADANGVLSAP